MKNAPEQPKNWSLAVFRTILGTENEVDPL